MKVSSLLVLAALIPAVFPVLAHAEIYKWKDKDGITRYSDIPPPSNVKNELLGKRIPKAPVVAPGEGVVAPVPGKDGVSAVNNVPALTTEQVAAKRAQEAEAQKKAEAAKQAELKYRQESCLAARKNLAMLNNGGRIMTVDEKGERHYFGEDEVAQGKLDAQRDMESFCN